MATIGYYDLGSNEGLSAQADIITGIGDTAVDFDTMAYNRGVNVEFVDNPITDGYNTDFNINATAITYWVYGGGVLVFNDAHAGTGFINDLATPYENGDNQINFVNDTGPIATGVGGALTDASLDNLGFSNDGYQNIQSVQDAEVAFLMTRDDPFHGVVTLNSELEGWFVLSSMNVSALLGNSASVDTYVANTLDYAVGLSTNVETILTDNADNFTGTAGGDEVFGRAGNDKILAMDGNDIIHAGDGADKINAGNGDDIAWGDAGIDVMKGANGNDQLWGGAEHDKINGGAGDDFLVGGTGNDVLKGLAGNDTMFGGDDFDHIYGGDGDDFIKGGMGADTMTGGAGADTYFFAPGESPTGAVESRDTVTDFVHGQDKIDLTEYQHPFTFSTNGTLDTPYEILLIDGPGVTTVLIDVDGDGLADAAIDVEPGGLTSSDFTI